MVLLMHDEIRVVRGVVEATTEKYGGGIKIDGTFYDIAEGVELPEKGIEIVAQVKGKKVISWKRVDDKSELDDSEIPRNVKAASDLFLAILKYLEYKAPDISTRDRMVIASIIFKEIMETKRVLLMQKSVEGKSDT